MNRMPLVAVKNIPSNRSMQIGALLALITFFSAGCSSRTTSNRSTFNIYGVQVSVPAPDGFVALADQSTGFRAFEERRIFGGKLIEIYLTKKELDDVIARHSKSRERMLYVQAPPIPINFDTEALAGAKSVIRDHGHMSSVTFDAISSRASAGVAEQIKNRQEQAWHPAPNRRWQGVYFEIPDAIGDSDIITLTKGGLIAEVRVNMRVSNRWLVLHCDGEMHRDADWQVLQDTCERWSQDIIRTNAPAVHG